MGYAAPNIILGVQQPHFEGPLDSVTKVLAARNLQADIGLRQAQQQQYQAEAEKNQRALNDQETLRNMLADPAHPEYSSQLAKGDVSFLNGKVDPLYQNLIATNATSVLDKTAQLHKTQLENTHALLGDIGNTIAGIQALPPEQRAQSANEALGRLKQLPGADQLQLPSSLNPSDVTDEGLTKFATNIGAEQAHYAAAMSRKELAGKAQEAAAKGQISQFEADLLQGKSAPGSVEARAEQIAPAAQFPDVNRDLVAGLKTATSVKALQEVQQKALDQVAARQPEAIKAEGDIAASKARALIPAEVEKQKAMIPGEVAKAVQQERATEPIRTAAQLSLQKQLYGGTGAFASVAPRLIEPAMKEAQKATDEYADAVNSIETMKNVVDQARAGNKIAYAYAPTTGVLTINTGQGVKRVNMAEIGQYAGAGSDWDKVKGFFGKHLEGEGISDDVLKAMDTFHGSALPIAQSRLTNKLAGVNQNYGSKLDAQGVIGHMGSGITPQTGTVKLKAPDGTIKDISVDQVPHYLSLGAQRVP